MKINKSYVIEEIVQLITDSEQLNLFEKDQEMNSTQLKYPRRKSRTIANASYKLEEPRENVSQTMQKIHASNTSIEKILEAELQKNKLNYSKPSQIIGNIIGKPDFILPKYKIAIFCDGDFWHGYQFEKGKIKNNSDFWVAKIERNILRDEEVTYGLQQNDWKVFRFWEHEINANVQMCVEKIKTFINENSEDKPLFTFVDLFAGIGGFRIPLEELGGKCLGFSEIDKQAIEVYKTNFCGYGTEKELELGDITKIGKLPFSNIDLIVGGVPCQSWSVAGKMRGFDDPRGKLWHDTIRVVSLNKPKAFIFENVKGLMDPRNKENLELIIKSFEDIGYSIKSPKLLNSYDFGLPQNRERIFIVGIRNDLADFLGKFDFPVSTNKKSFLKDLIDTKEKKVSIEKKLFEPTEIFGDKIPMGRNRFQKVNEMNDFFIFCDTRNGHTTIHSWDIIKTTTREKDICMQILRNRRKKIYGPADGNPLSYKALKNILPNLKEAELKKLVAKKILRFAENIGYEFVNSKNSAGIGGIYRVYLPHSNIFSTLTATGTKDMVALKTVEGNNPKEYKENFIKEIIKKKLFRPITAKEAGRLQGFPYWFSISTDEKQAKKQFGNAVSTSVIFHLSKSLKATEIFNTPNHDTARKRPNSRKV